MLTGRGYLFFFRTSHDLHVGVPHSDDRTLANAVTHSAIPAMPAGIKVRIHRVQAFIPERKWILSQKL